MIKLRTLIIVWLAVLVLLIWAWRADGKSFDQKVTDKLTGGSVSTKSMALWELCQYKDTILMRKSPLCYAPWKAYIAVNDYVTIESRNNRYYLCINTNLKRLLHDDATFNRAFAKAFKASGTRKQQVRKIWKYCGQTKYVVHVKTAREVFQKREGDCAGIASAFYVLCRAKGIPVRYVIGWSKGCHAWNRVKVSGRWYWIDATYRYWLCYDLWDGRSIMEMW